MISLKQAYDFFIFDRETFCNQKTLDNYKNNLRYFLEYMTTEKEQEVSKILITQIKLDDIKGYVIYLRSRDKLSTHPFKPTVHKPITNTSVRTYCIDLRTFFNFLYKNDYLENNVMKNFKLIKPENKLILPVYESEMKELDATFNLKSMTGLRNYCIVHCMIDVGLRSSDVCNLNVSDINFKDNHIVIYKGKGLKDRVVPLSAKLKKYLNMYVQLYRPHCDCDTMFVSVDGNMEPITANTIKSLFARLREKSGIKRLKPHLLRHTFATSYILGGGDLESLRIIMGHSSIETTQGYLHLANTYNLMNMDCYKLDKIFFKKYY